MSKSVDVDAYELISQVFLMQIRNELHVHLDKRVLEKQTGDQLI